MKNPMRSDSDTVEYKSSKRKKSIDTSGVYSKRQIPWEEQLQLPERFHESGEGTWPALAILQEKTGKNKKKQYLVEWEPHPLTGEKFEPTWVCASKQARGYPLMVERHTAKSSRERSPQTLESKETPSERTFRTTE